VNLLMARKVEIGGGTTCRFDGAFDLQQII
jgi:hypothetical protein